MNNTKNTESQSNLPEEEESNDANSGILVEDTDGNISGSGDIDSSSGSSDASGSVPARATKGTVVEAVGNPTGDDWTKSN